MKAKLAWICYSDEDDDYPTIKFYKPSEYRYYEIIPIVYFEVEKEG